MAWALFHFYTVYTKCTMYTSCTPNESIQKTECTCMTCTFYPPIAGWPGSGDSKNTHLCGTTQNMPVFRGIYIGYKPGMIIVRWYNPPIPSKTPILQKCPYAPLYYHMVCTVPSCMGVGLGYMHSTGYYLPYTHVYGSVHTIYTMYQCTIPSYPLPPPIPSIPRIQAYMGHIVGVGGQQQQCTQYREYYRQYAMYVCMHTLCSTTYGTIGYYLRMPYIPYTLGTLYTWSTGNTPYTPCTPYTLCTHGTMYTVYHAYYHIPLYPVYPIYPVYRPIQPLYQGIQGYMGWYRGSTTWYPIQGMVGYYPIWGSTRWCIGYHMVRSTVWYQGVPRVYHSSMSTQYTIIWQCACSTQGEYMVVSLLLQVVQCACVQYYTSTRAYSTCAHVVVYTCGTTISHVPKKGWFWGTLDDPWEGSKIPPF